MRLATITLAILLCGILFPAAAAPQTSTLPAQISDAEFWRIFTEFSEPKAYPLGINIIFYAMTH